MTPRKKPDAIPLSIVQDGERLHTNLDGFARAVGAILNRGGYIDHIRFEVPPDKGEEQTTNPDRGIVFIMEPEISEEAPEGTVEST